MLSDDGIGGCSGQDRAVNRRELIIGAGMAIAAVLPEIDPGSDFTDEEWTTIGGITEANLVDYSEAPPIFGTWTFSSDGRNWLRSNALSKR